MTREASEAILDAVDALSELFLGQAGIVAISDAIVNTEIRLIVVVQGDPTEALALLPKTFKSFPVIVSTTNGLTLYPRFET